ncbi:MAG: EamA family transporter [Rhizobiales bacterium]|nr:DMT family transporter [Hyphomicrobiales bacterium]NRB15943.1 EamA family transporter [Hyphomicrobiales bacterium]
MNKKIWNYSALHFAIFAWGASGVTAGLMSMSAAGITVYRSAIAFVVLLAFNYIIKASAKLTNHEKMQLLITGMILGVHWLCFFTSIKYSTVSIALICIASGPIFVAIIQPFLDKLPIKKSQIILGSTSIVALAIIFEFESQYKIGIIIGLLAGFLDAIYTVYTARINPQIKSSVVAQYQLFGAAAIIFVAFMFIEPNWQWLAVVTVADIWGVIFLGVVCSAIAMSLYVFAIKKLSPFTAILSLNLEAVYGIVLALIIFGEKEYMSAGLYFGGAMLICCVAADGYLSRNAKTA